MKRITFLIAIAVIALSYIKASATTNNKDFLGTWAFESQHAPEGYQTGVFSIVEKEGELAGEVRFPGGYIIEMENVKLTNGVLTFTIQVDYNPINIKATIEETVLKGSAASPEGDIPFEAKRMKNE